MSWEIGVFRLQNICSEFCGKKMLCAFCHRPKKKIKRKREREREQTRDRHENGATFFLN